MREGDIYSWKWKVGRLYVSSSNLTKLHSRNFRTGKRLEHNLYESHDSI